MDNNNSSFFVIRTPRLSVSKLRELKNKDTVEVLTKWLSLPGIKEALYFASPSLYERVPSWLSNQNKNSKDKTTIALLKYMIRMCSRPTPFGLFSGVACGEINEEKSNLTTRNYTSDLRKTRLDMFYLSKLKESIVNSSDTVNICYKTNPSFYIVGDQFRYIESYVSNEKIQYRLSSVEREPYFDFIINFAENGVSFEELVSLFCSKYESFEVAEVRSYIEELIEAKVLMPDVPLYLTGGAPDKLFSDSIVDISPNISKIITEAINGLVTADSEFNINIDSYKRTFDILLASPIEPQENRIFQSDLYRSFSSCVLNCSEINKLKKNLDLLVELAGVTENNVFNNFISDFNARFEGQYVPFNILLDDETGLGISSETGYEAPLIAGLNLMGTNLAKSSKVMSLSTPSLLDVLIERAISSPESKNLECIYLDKIDLVSKNKRNLDVSNYLSSSYSVLVSAFNENNGDIIFKFNGCNGPSSANLLGRFCHLNEKMKHLVIDELEKEQLHSENIIFAEIVHVPDGRPGNVIARPHLRKYEIVFMADSNLAKEYQIHINDLYVYVEANKVKLWSKRLNKEVVPRLSCAHNFSRNSLSAYKFLCMIQQQNSKVPKFNLPISTVNHVYIPRIVIGNIILNEKTWRIDRKEIENIIIEGNISLDFLESLLKKYNLDPIVNYAVSDNVLQLDLRNPEMLRVLLAETRGKNIIELKEVLTESYSSLVKDHEGNDLNNEIVIPIFNDKSKVNESFKKPNLSDLNISKVTRTFAGGSEWLSLKVYSGNSVVEKTLIEKINPIIKANKHLFDKWFFIRYGDPDWHIRLRFKGNPEWLCGVLLLEINNVLSPLLQSKQLHRLELMTYERELERYGGGDSIDVVETLFMLDSELVTRACTLVESAGENVRWRTALIYVDRLLSLFDYTIKERIDFISNLRMGFGLEFKEDAKLRKSIGKKYRNFKLLVENDFNCVDPNDDIMISINEWECEAKQFVEKIKEISKSGNLTCSLDSLISSLTHMHCNRIFKAYGRQQEYIVYDFLRKVYLSNVKSKIN